MQSFQEKLHTIITLLEQWLTEPTDQVQLEQWLDSAETIVYAYELKDHEQDYMDRILDIYEAQWRAMIQLQSTESVIALSTLDQLLARKQTEQRTTEWYQQMTTILSASELGHLFGSKRERAKLVIAKTVPYQPRFQPLAVPSDTMSAFDWGIRFEPVVKQIYELKYGATIKELGRLIHSTDTRCSASPDGLVYHCPLNQRTGHLIEIKCPVTREIDGTVPKDYYAQMQMQLQVTQLTACEYVEAVFTSPYHHAAIREGPGLYNGYIALVRYAERKGDQEFYYAYSPVNCEATWLPTIQPEEDVMELIPWSLHQWGEQVVQRNEEWWASLQPMMEDFWRDVELAKQGAFTVPELTRPAKKQKTEVCMIQFHKMDEEGINEIIG
jgi:hypothetical protein